MKHFSVKKQYEKYERKRLERIIRECKETHKSANCTAECDAFYLCRKGGLGH